MKYILLISMIVFALSPQGLCSGDTCCQSDYSHEQIVSTDSHESADYSASCCSSDETEKDKEHSQSSSHNCECCMANVTLIFQDMDEVEIPFNSSTIDKGSKKLTSRFSFSIWIPPNKAA